MWNSRRKKRNELLEKWEGLGMMYSGLADKCSTDDVAFPCAVPRSTLYRLIAGVYGAHVEEIRNLYR